MNKRKKRCICMECGKNCALTANGYPWCHPNENGDGSCPGWMYQAIPINPDPIDLIGACIDVF